VPSAEVATSGDPTGCGDVFGATVVARLLGGDPLEAAVREANRLAARNVSAHGATGLQHHLRGGILAG
jgi:sugar/nucleoside kinase (ribokinase family)